MKMLMIAVFSCRLAVCFGQNPEAMEQDLVNSMRKIAYWRDYPGSDDKIERSDSVEKANRVFEKKLLAYTSRHLPTIGFGFRSLRKEGLSIASSADGLFRIYSWDTWMGGTMHIFATVYQYRVGDKVFSKTIDDPIPEGDPGSFYSKIFSLTHSGRTYYLGVNHAIYSTGDSYQGINVFAISGHSLNNTIKLIKTQTGMHNSLGFEYNFFSVADRPERPVKLIDYDSATRTIRIPVVMEDGTVTDKTINYRYTGRYFERVSGQVRVKGKKTGYHKNEI